MDYYTIALTCCLTLIAHAAHIPKVYESNSPRQPLDKYEKPPEFNYQAYQQAQKGNQLDPQRIRYQQQQQVDNSPTRQAKSSEFTTEMSRPFTSTFGSTSTSTSKVILQELERESSLMPMPKSKIAKKSLKPNSYLVKEEEEPAGNRHDDSGYLNYVDNRGFPVAPSGGDQLTALSSLLGQTPENQLHGLQQLLNVRERQTPKYVKNPTPIRKDVLDYPNTQNKPNVKVLHQSQAHSNHVVNQALQSLQKHGPDALKSLQAHLDATASVQAENLIAQAQNKALEHVKAQHEAIARAQKQAEAAALEQIKAQNEAIARAHAQAEQDAEERRQKEAKQTDEKRKAAERRRQQERELESARLAALAHKRKQEEQSKDKEGQIDDAHTGAHNTRANGAQKHKKLQVTEPAETQNHYFTAPTQSHFTPVQLFPQAAVAAPVVHQPNVHHAPAPTLNTPTHKYKPKHNAQDNHAEVDKYYIPQFTVIGHAKNADGEQELQYAANYEFGYRIRDYDNGNNYGHKETKDGETTKGEYHALMPDGRMQTVTYYVDESGYHAKVSYARESTHH